MANQSKKTFSPSSNAEGATEESSTANQAPRTQSSLTEAIPEIAKNVVSQAKDTAGNAYDLATEKVTSNIDEQKTNLSGGLSDVADSLRKVGETLRDSGKQNPVIDSAVKYGDLLARRVEQISDYLEQKDLPEILRDTERFAKRNPAIFVSGALLLGFAATRFLKSSNPHQAMMRRAQNSGAAQSQSATGANNPAASGANPNGGDRQNANQPNANQT